jgi:tripartite-type tricarboxylate transporter receptor subunit TctC
MGMSEHVLATHPGQRPDVGERHRAKHVPGKPLSYASFGQGTSAHLAGEMLKAQLGVDLVHIPYKGQAPALADLLGGQVAMMFGNWPEFRGAHAGWQAGATRHGDGTRSVYAPQVPTLAEQGVPLESNSWNGLLAPAGTPDALVQRLNTEVNKALASTADGAEAFRAGGIASLSGTPAQFAEFIHAEIAKYGDVIRKANIQVEG